MPRGGPRYNPLISETPLVNAPDIRGGASYSDIARWCQETDGRTVHYYQVKHGCEVLFEKVRKELVKYPEIRDALEEIGLDWRDFK